MSSNVLASMTSHLNLSNADVLGKCRPIREYLKVAVRAFNSSSGIHGVYWPSYGDRAAQQPIFSKRGSMSMVFSMLSKDPVLSMLSEINLKSGMFMYNAD